jgi:tRNA(adenine34) deaminase
MGALYWSQLDRVVFGASDPKRGFTSQGVQAHPKTKIQGGVLAEDSGALMEHFFKDKR